MSASSLSPREVAAALERRLVGQDEAVREMSIAVAKKLSGLGAGNVLMLGSSGTGKTTLMRAVEEFLAARADARAPQIRLHASVLAGDAARGRAGEEILLRLLARARELDPEASPAELETRLAGGLVFVDEVDKIRADVGGKPNVAGIRAQEGLLTLIENESVTFDPPSWFGKEALTVNASSLLFVCAGAFEGLYDAVYDRVTVGKDRGALEPVTVVGDGGMREEIHFRLRDWLDNQDLFDYGMLPQFLSRFGSLVLLDDLDEDALVKIFLNSADSALKQSQVFFAAQGLELAISPSAVRRIAAEAAREPRLGARALTGVFRRVIRRYEFDPESSAEGGSVMIDLPEVEAALRRG